MCGSWGASKCSPMRWFEYMGDHANNPFVPFQINYLPRKSPDVQDEMKPLNLKVIPCSQPINVSFFYDCLIHLFQFIDLIFEIRKKRQLVRALIVWRHVQSRLHQVPNQSLLRFGAMMAMQSWCSLFSSLEVWSSSWVLDVVLQLKVKLHFFNFIVDKIFDIIPNWIWKFARGITEMFYG